jgi:hypothetical protein
MPHLIHLAILFATFTFHVIAQPTWHQIISPVNFNYGFHAGVQLPQMPNLIFQEKEVPFPVPDLATIEIPMFIPTISMASSQMNHGTMYNI